MPSTQQILRARRWTQRHHAELTKLGWDSLTDPVGTRYTLDGFRFCVFTNDSTRWQYLLSLFRLGERRGVRNVPEFTRQEHTRRLRKWIRDQYIRQALTDGVMVPR